MSEVLLIRLGSHAADMIPWMVWSDAEKEIIASGELDNASELVKLTEHGLGRETKVLVPGADVTMKTVELPGKFNRQLQAALPYMLEDDLTQDVDKLFFAIGDKGQSNGKHTIDVAIVDRKLMQNWLNWLQAAQLQATQFVPDALCLPLYEHGTCGIELNDQWLVRSSKWQCSSIDSSWFGDYLSLSAAQFKAAQAEGAQERYTFITHSPCLMSGDNLVIEEQSPELPLKLLNSHIKSAGFNLLQGDFAFKKEGSKVWKVWKHAVILAVVALIMQLSYRGGMAWHLSGEVEKEKAVFVEMYKQAFPGTRMRPNRMEGDLRRKVKALQSGGSADGGFLPMLEQVAPLFAQSGSFVPNSFRYDAKRNELRMEATANGFQDFEKFKTAAEKAGFTVQQGSLNNDGDKVAGSISVRRGG